MILEATLAGSFQPPHSCRDGCCGPCLVKLISRNTAMRSEAALSARENALDLLLAWQACPFLASMEIELNIDNPTGEI